MCRVLDRCVVHPDGTSPALCCAVLRRVLDGYEQAAPKHDEDNTLSPPAVSSILAPQRAPAAPACDASKLQDLQRTCQKLAKLWVEADPHQGDAKAAASFAIKGIPCTHQQHARNDPEGTTATQAQNVHACSALLGAVQQLAPHAALSAKAHCLLAEAWLEGPEGGAPSALQV